MSVFWVAQKAKKNLFLMSLGLFIALLLIFPEHAHASAAGSNLPWEAPLQTITRSIQGPVAYAICLLAIIGCGGMLVWGGEINEFMRRGIMLVLVISVIIFASGLLSTLFNTSAALL